jgi:hypothetical protein
MPVLARIAIVATVALWTLTGRGEAQTRGLFINSAAGATELLVYAEATHGGRLRMARGELEQAPVVHEVLGILSSLPNWRPIAVIVATTELFRHETAERRQLPIAIRMRNVFAAEVRAVDLEKREQIISLLRAIKASPDTPGYAFVVLDLNGVRRYYPIRLTPRER